VTLECALAGVPPLIVYRTDAASAFIARRLLTVDHVGLPNLVLGARCFPELLQAEAEPKRMAIALERMLAERPRLLTDTERVRAALDPEMRPSHRVADLLA
jgi:lipid-A-disaccharide synthase